MRNEAMAAILITVTLATPITETNAGVYIGTAECQDDGDCFPLAFLSDPSHTVPPFAITHPPGYTGAGGVLQIRVCIASGSEALASPARRAIATWNRLIASTGNCNGCITWEDGPSGIPLAHAETTLLHELGHCPLGLGHPDRNWDAQATPDGVWEPTSFTRSWGVAAPPSGINAGADFIRGTLDDVQQGPGMLPQSVNWFRIADNNPVVVDNTTIDINTYSRAAASNLPPRHNWSANGNRKTAERLGFPNTQAVMYGLQEAGERKTALTADDVAMVKMAMAGRDFLAGTVDDYDVEIILLESCTGTFEVLIEFGPTISPESLGECKAAVDFSYPQNPLLTRHVTLKPPPGQTTLKIVLNQAVQWDTDPAFPIFGDGFETGDLSNWSVGPP